MKDKKVIIAGGSKGIGRATGLAFAGKGADILFTHRNRKEATETMETLVNQGEARQIIQANKGIF